MAGGSKNLSKILDRASHSAFVTGEWYMPGQRLIGFRAEEPASMATWMGEGGGSIRGFGSGGEEAEAIDRANTAKREDREVGLRLASEGLREGVGDFMVCNREPFM